MAMDFEAWKEFMAEQQAQFWADLRAMEATQAEDRQRIATLVDVCMSLATNAEETDRRLRATDQRLRELGEETDRRIRELRDAQAHSDERLDALINVVDALVKRNGKRD